MPNDPWFTCLPSCEAQVPCGPGRHTVRWEAGQLVLPEHPDAEAELVLAALGGEKAGCVELAEAWSRHSSDLSMLVVGPRGPADEITVGWEDVEAAAQEGRPGSVAGFGGSGLAALGQLASPPAMAGVRARQRQLQAELDQTRLRRNDILSLLALGYGFQLRLAGQVVAAHADGADADAAHSDSDSDSDSADADGDVPGGPEADARPALVAAITSRLGLVAEQWLGIDPDQVVVSLHRGPGWGQVELTGYGDERRLRVALPASWLARVWACGLALTGGQLVVAVEQAGWPRARVLALRAPGAEPVSLDVHARGALLAEPGPDGSAAAEDAPHWEV
jgi:hypothetical protein